MESLFAYGTLMCNDIMREVAGVQLFHVPGIVKGYSRRAVRGECYPALVPDEAGSVQGIVYRDVPAEAWERLDRFEGEMYVRQTVQIKLNDGATLDAVTYIINPAFLDHLDAVEWDFDDFLRNGKAIFRKRHKGYWYF